MDNRDMPAMPIPSEFSASIHPNRLAVGFSKREYIATMAMQGIMSNPSCEPTKQLHFDNIAEDSIRAADALLKQLEESE